jgi:hypothetical protein
MSLSVDVYVGDAAGTMLKVLDTPEGKSDLAGPESWRTKVWGSEAVRSLGARFFPQLAETDLYVNSDEMPAFIEECAMLRQNLALISKRPETARGDEVDAVSFRLGNIEDAAARALSMGACVVVW